MITKELINSEVEKLRKELLAKLEEPKFEEDKWYRIHYTWQHCSGLPYDKYPFYIVRFKEKQFLDTRDVFELPCGTQVMMANNVIIDWFERLATPSEVQSALEAEAVKIGFKKNITIIQPNGIKLEIYSGNFVISVDALELYFCGATIFSKGKWATIIKEKTSEEWVDEFLKNENYALDQFAIFLKKNNLKITKK